MLELANHWLATFEKALAGRDDVLLESLFHADCHWRDVLALTWRITTVNGRADVLKALKSVEGRFHPTGFRTDPHRTAPRRVTRAGTQAIEAIFQFETAEGRGNGVLRLLAEEKNTLRAWTLLTALDELKGFEEQAGNARPGTGYADRDPVVLVVGGGQAGVSIAARLAQLQVDTLIVDREPRIGDNWRKRYHALTLHNRAHVNHFAYLPFPPDWPSYIPKDQLAGWFETYVERLQLRYWTATEFTGATYDKKAARWSVELHRADGTQRELHPRHLVMATGASGIPNLPDIPTLQAFGGTILHSSQYVDGDAWTGRNALVIGSGTSGHDIAKDLHSSGAKVTLVQRSPTLIVNIEPSAQLPYALYDEGPPLEDCDLITASMPLALAKRSHQLLTEQAKQLDQTLLDALARVGFKLDFGEDGTGWQFKYLTRGGGYYFNVGCSDLIVEGKIGLAQFSELDKILPGTDLVVLATGYKGQEHLVRKLLGDDVAARVGPIWGFGDEQELRNMFKRTAQPGLWFIAGSFAQCRIYSKYLALQIKATEIGLLS